MGQDTKLFWPLSDAPDTCAFCEQPLETCVCDEIWQTKKDDEEEP
jgi:hypothetical protein